MKNIAGNVWLEDSEGLSCFILEEVQFQSEGQLASKEINHTQLTIKWIDLIRPAKI